MARNKEKKIEPTKKAHVVEEINKSRYSHKKREFKKSNKGKKKLFKRTRTKMNYYVCGKPGHLARAYCHRKDGDDHYINRKNGGKRRVQDDDFAIVFIETTMARYETD